jgi:hypothetical protein
LPRLLAGGDNAAMQTEPPKAKPPKHNRRWFQFSLQTLMIVVTAVCIVGGVSRWLMPISPLYACIASIWAATAAVVICQLDLRDL